MSGFQLDVGAPVPGLHVHGDSAVRLLDVEMSVVLNSRKQAAPEETDETLVGLAPPDEDPVLQAVAAGIANGHPVGHILGREAEPAWKALGAQLLHPDQADAYDCVAIEGKYFERRRQQRGDRSRVRAKIQQNPPANDAFQGRQHFKRIAAAAPERYQLQHSAAITIKFPMDPSAQYALEAAAIGASASFMAWSVRGRSATLFGQSVWRGPGARRAIALTFDDGPSEGTPLILEILERYRVPATFFQCGVNVERLPELARAVRQAGHDIGNHSHTHPLLCFRSPAFMEEDLRRAQESIEDHTGCRPEFFRAPFGVRWFGIGGVQRRLNLTGVMWTIIGYDWNRKPDRVVERFNRVSNGAILALHDGRELRARPDIGVTVEAVRRLVPMLLDQGYQFETVSRLLCPMN